MGSLQAFLTQPRRKRKYPFITTILRKFRVDKTKPRRLTLKIEEDLNAVKQVTRISFPENTEIEQNIIPNERNPDLIYLLASPLKIVYYKTSGKFFAYSPEGRFITELEEHNIKNLWLNITGLLGSVQYKRKERKLILWGKLRKWWLEKNING